MANAHDEDCTYSCCAEPCCYGFVTSGGSEHEVDCYNSPTYDPNKAGQFRSYE